MGGVVRVEGGRDGREPVGDLVVPAHVRGEDELADFLKEQTSEMMSVLVFPIANSFYLFDAFDEAVGAVLEDVGLVSREDIEGHVLVVVLQGRLALVPLRELRVCANLITGKKRNDVCEKNEGLIA